jgi:hypothetical protein
MLQTDTTSYGSRLRLEPWIEPRTVQLPRAERVAVRHDGQTEAAMDETLAASFPASDPPAWNPGLARAGPVDTLRDRPQDAWLAVASGETNDGSTPGVIDVSGPYPSGRTPLEMLISLAGAAGVALLVPFAILLAGLPIALAVRGLLEVFPWLFPGIGG